MGGGGSGEGGVKIPIPRRAKLGQIQGGGCRRPSKIRQRGGCNNFLLFTR